MKISFGFLMLALTTIWIAGAFGQQASPLADKVLQLQEGATSPPATIEDAAWLEGHWEGDLEGAHQQHMVYSAASGHMPGFVRAWGENGDIWFYEIAVFAEVNNSLELRVKHFTSNLVGWEGQEEFIARRLVKLTDEALFFDGATFVKNGPDDHIVYYRIPDGEREGDIVVVHQTRIK